MKIHVFDEDKLPRRVLDRTWPNLAAKSAENDPKMAPQDDPKSTKNRCQKMIEILIDNKTNFMPSWREREVSWGDLGASLGDLAAILGAPKELNTFGGGGPLAQSELP